MAIKNKKIKICFVAPKTYPLFNPAIDKIFGGAEVDLYYVGTELAKDIHFEVIFVTADYGQPEVELRENATIIKGLNFNENIMAGAVKVWRAMSRANADIYLMKSGAGVFFVAFFCIMKKKLFVYRTSSSIHCDGTYVRKHPLVGRLFRWSIRRANIVVSQNENDKLNLKKYMGVNAVVIKNGHRIKGNPKVQRNIILWVGRSIECKRPYMFIELARQYHEEKFIMICQRATGDNKYDELVREAERVENLQFIKRVPFLEISSYFEIAKVFVNTSHTEGFANTFIQACNHGVPILSLKINPDGFVDKYKCGICADDDWEKFVESFKILLNPEIGGEYGRNGLEYAKQNHDITEIIREYKELFNALL